jgi:hypothetical protein
VDTDLGVGCRDVESAPSLHPDRLQKVINFKGEHGRRGW